MKRLIFTITLAVLHSQLAFTQDSNSGLPNDRRELTAYSKASALPSQIDYLRYDEMGEIFQNVKDHPVAATTPGNIQKYDPTGAIGFCFGRSMAVHLLAKKKGLNSQSIQKLFIIGDLRSGTNPEWRFHVTTVVKGIDGWYAIDPILDAPMPMIEWMRTVKSIWDKGDKAKLYLTHADAILPDLLNVVPVEKETCKNIIELCFNPSLKTSEGIVKTNVGSIPRVYRLNSGAANKYFSSTTESPSSRFHFLSIKLSTRVMSYNGYFTDLLGSLNRPSPRFVLNSALMESVQISRRMGGMNLSVILRK